MNRRFFLILSTLGSIGAALQPQLLASEPAIQTCTRPQPHTGPCNGWPCASVRRKHFPESVVTLAAQDILREELAKHRNPFDMDEMIRLRLGRLWLENPILSSYAVETDRECSYRHHPRLGTGCWAEVRLTWERALKTPGISDNQIIRASLRYHPSREEPLVDMIVNYV